MTFAKILASFLGLPRWVHLALAGGLAFLIWLQFHDSAVVADHEAGVQQQVQASASAGATAAASEVAKSKTEVEKANAEARDAAARRPDDPLRAGLDSLRAKESPAKPASR